MNSESTSDISRFLTSLIVPALLAWLLIGARREARVRVKEGRLVLEYGGRVRILAWLFLAFAGFLVFAATKAAPDQRVMAAAVSGGLTAMIGVFAIEVFRVRAEFDEANIRCFSPWRRNRVIPWAAIESITYSAMNQWWVARTRGHGRIRLHQLISGAGDFVAAAKARGIAVDGPLPAPPVRR